MKHDPHEGSRGKWDVAGSWWCDCPGKNNATKYICRRCDVRRPLKGSTVYSLQMERGHAGFMSNRSLKPVSTLAKVDTSRGRYGDDDNVA